MIVVKDQERPRVGTEGGRRRVRGGGRDDRGEGSEWPRVWTEGGRRRVRGGGWRDD